MKADFWLDKWAKHEIGFHLPEVHPLLEKYSAELVLENARVLVPLCGKSLDMVYLAGKGAHVTGVELSGRAVEEFFAGQSQEPEVREEGEHRVYQQGSIELWQGDFFQLPSMQPYDVVYDRAALIALPEDMRIAYGKKVASLVRPGGRLLLISLAYGSAGGPPFSLSESDVKAAYSDFFDLQKTGEYPSDVKGIEAVETVWLGTRKEE